MLSLGAIANNNVLSTMSFAIAAAVANVAAAAAAAAAAAVVSVDAAEQANGSKMKANS